MPRMDAIRVTPETLNQYVEFDVPFEIREGNTEALFVPETDVYAPSSIDGELDDAAWSYWTHGRSGQYGYSGPIMHPSEIIAGNFARDLLSEPGVYVFVADECVTCDTDYCDGEGICDGEHSPNGWAIARLND